MENSNEQPRPDQPPNLLLLITDQQRRPQHWPDDPAWLADLTPADAELARTGLSFTNACSASCMCSPSRASLLTGRWPAEHGVDLTLTQGGARTEPRYLPGAIAAAVETARNGSISPARIPGVFARGIARRPNGGKDEHYLDPDTPNLARVLERRGYRTVIKGKWHLTNPIGEEWEQRDSDLMADRYGMHGWVPPDAGENLEPSGFGGGKGAGVSGEGFDEDFTRQAEAFLADPPPEPWALIVSLINPHDVLAYPGSYREGGYREADWADLDEVGLPASIDEDLSNKPTTHVLTAMGQASFIGGLGSERAKLDYCRFYAHLHRLVDEKVGRVLRALGDPEDPASLRNRTVIVRTSDHGEMGLSHGGMRQKMFNAYEEAINVPLIVSNPTLFPNARETDAPASLCDLMPTLAGIAGVDVSGDGVRGDDLGPVLARHAGPDRERLRANPVDLGAIAEHEAPADSVRDASHFTFDDHQSGSAYVDVAPPPNHIRSVRTNGSMYAVYFDPEGRAENEYELYDMERDPLQVDNLLERSTGRPIRAADRALRDQMHERLIETMIACGTVAPIG